MDIKAIILGWGVLHSTKQWTLLWTTFCKKFRFRKRIERTMMLKMMLRKC